MAQHRIQKIVSGGQTGVDRAALEVGLELGIAIGGWVPRGRRAEDGPVPARYAGLQETDSAEYKVRTEWNVRDSDATIALYRGSLNGGTALTVRLANVHGKPVMHLDLAKCGADEAAAQIRDWLGRQQPAVLNVAGSRESGDAGVFGAVCDVLRRALQD